MTHHIPGQSAGARPDHVPTARSVARPRPAAPQVSVLSIVSLILGAVSVPLICACYLSLFTSIPAVITGHIGYSQCRRAKGALTGSGLSLAGLILGYFSLAVTGVWLTVGIVGLSLSKTDVADNDADVQASGVPGQAELSAAESRVVSDNDGYAHGNSAEARELARQFADEMKALDEAFFTQTDTVLKLSGGKYVTWCELREGKCAFVVHVPEYRKFDKEAKGTLAHLAWGAAQRVVAGKLAPEDDLAVGLKGVLLYGAVMTGQVEYEDEDPGERMLEDGDDKALLYPFFVAETAQPSTPETGPESSSSAPQTGSETEPGPVAASDPQVSAPSELMPAEPPGLDVAEPLPTAPAPNPSTPDGPDRPQRPTATRIVPETVEEALEFLKGDDDIRRQQAISFLAHGDATGPDAAVADALFKHLDVEHGGGRFFVATALRKWASADDLDRLEPLLDDENVLVQTHVVETIGLLGTKQAAQVLARRLTVREHAASVSYPLQKMGIVAEQPVLAQLRKPNLDIATQTQIILVLAEVGGRDSFRTLQRMAANQSHPLRFSAKSAAEKIQQRLAE